MARQELTVAQKNRQFRQRAAWGFFTFAMVLTATLRMLTVAGFPKLETPLGPPNPDVWLRLTQVRQWLTGGDFFDHLVQNTNAPFGGVTTPWTRPVDTILSAFYFLTPGHLSMDLRLMIAAAWMPPALCVIAVFLMAKAARRHFEHTHVLISVMMLTIFNAYLGDYFSPGDADHHSTLSVLWCGVLCLITIETLSWPAALAAGALLGGMVWVSPEGLMLMAPVYGLLGLEALFRPQKMPALAVTTLGAASVAMLALFIERKDISQEIYDSVSIVQVTLLWLTAAAAGILAFLYRRGISLRARMGAAAAVGAGVLAGMWILYPKFFQGPLVDVDPFIFTGFLPNVSEARSLTKFPWTDMLREMAQPLIAVSLVIFTCRRGIKHLRPEKKRFLLLLSALLVYAAVLTSVQIRWEYYLQPVAIILGAALLPGVSMATRFRRLRNPPPRQWRPYLWMTALFAALNVSTTTFAKERPLLADQMMCINEVRYVIQTQQLQPLLGDTNMVVFFPENAAGDALFFTPYRIIASNYHREGKGLKDLNELTRALHPDKALAILGKRQVKALFYCPIFYGNDTWLSEIGKNNQHPRWLEPVKGLRFFELPEVTIPKPVLFKMKD
ncbi:MAG: hypothetical protein ACAH83_09515 [Alphaproteobacteria bacterium]